MADYTRFRPPLLDLAMMELAVKEGNRLGRLPG
jgi:hypothetical protein